MADDFVPVPYGELVKDIGTAVDLLYEDIEHFTSLSVDQMQSLMVKVKKYKPRPEQKEGHAFILVQMKEEFEFAKTGDEINPKPADKQAEETPTPEPIPQPAPEPKVQPTAKPMPEITQVVSAEVAQRVAESSCVLEFYQSQPTFKKQVASSLILNSAQDPGISGIDPGRLKVSKAIIEAAELKGLVMHRNRFFKKLARYTLPGGLLTLAGGQHLVPLTAVTTLQEMIQEYIDTRETLLIKFQERYPEIIEHAKIKLAGLFNEADYPPFEVIKDGYQVHYRFVSNKVPEEFKKMNKALYDREAARVHEACKTAALDIEEALRTRLADSIEHLAGRLGNDEKTGRPKQLHSSVVEGLKDFLSTFKEFNLTGDEGLEKLVNQAKELIGDATADTIRDSETFRLKLKEGFDKLKDQASELVEVRKRKIILE